MLKTVKSKFYKTKAIASKIIGLICENYVE